MLFKYLFFAFALAYSIKGTAQNYVFDYNATCRAAYTEYMSMHLDKGREYILEAMRDNPYNLAATFISDYEDCLLLLFNGDKKDLEQRKSHLDLRLQLLSKADGHNPWYRLSKAGIYMHWALVHIRFGDNFKAATAFRKSYLLLKENRKLFPEFEYNNVYFGLEETAVGVIPDDYRWIAAIFGMKGSVKKGIEKLDRFVASKQENDLLQREAAIFSIYLKFYLLHDQEAVWKYINNSRKFTLEDNLLNQFVYANIAINYRKAQSAIDVLKVAEKGSLYKKYPILDYEMGSAFLNKTDLQAITYLHSFLNNFHGRIFIKDAWQKMCYAYWLAGNTRGAETCRGKILSSGSLMVDADKQAQRFAQEKQYPDKRLLSARLLIDGGFYEQALSILGKYSEDDFTDEISRIEYFFRMGRIYEELGRDKEALACYSKTEAMGRGRKEYYAARAVLQMAFVYEHNGNTTAAIKKYRECLGMKGHDFQNSIDQMAKAGINRLQ